MNIIIDSNNLLFRAGHNIRLQEGDDMSSSSIAHRFLQIVRSYYQKYSPDNVYLCWDKRIDNTIHNFRKDIFPEYKKGRAKSGVAETIINSSDICVDLTESLGFYNVFPKYAEADDIVYFLSYYLSGHNTVISVDKDLYQCISDICSVFNPLSKKTLNKENFESNTGVKLNRWALYLSIMGDKVDNIDGLYRFGKVKSARLANEYHNIKELSPEQKETIRRNMDIIDLKRMHIQDEFDCYTTQLSTKPSVNMDKFKTVCDEHGISDSEVITWSKLRFNDTLLTL